MEYPQIKTVHLKKLAFALNMAVSKELVFDINLDVRQDAVEYVANSLLIAMRAKLWTHQVPGEVKLPANIWEHAKLLHAPRWFTRRWPVRYTSVRVDAIAVLPELVVSGHQSFNSYEVHYPEDWPVSLNDRS